MELYVYLNGEKRGPFSEERIQQFLRDGLLRPTDLAGSAPEAELRPLASLFARENREPTQLPNESLAASPPFTLPRLPAETLGPYARATLAPNETAYLKTSLHWIIFIRYGILGLVLFFFLALPFAIVVQALFGSEVGWFALPLPAFAMVPPAVAFASSELVVTNLRVLIKTGIIRRQTLEMFISKVESIAVDQGFLGRIFGYGTVLIRGTG
ncbi:MAG: PH domain-containing protein, partial [Verrucomicrobiota bacterium]|nr:PH domain-containing protein [Verrucomicrobiota bacterium]